MTGGFNSKVPGRLYYTWHHKKDEEHWKGMGMINFFMLVDMKVVRKAAYISTTVYE